MVYWGFRNCFSSFLLGYLFMLFLQLYLKSFVKKKSFIEVFSLLIFKSKQMTSLLVIIVLVLAVALWQLTKILILLR
jgi:hypothetical protein